MSKVYFSLATGTFGQNWGDTGLITANDNWASVPSIEGFLGENIVTTTGANPGAALASSTFAQDLSVLANQTNPGFISAGDVAEFELANPTIALQASATADAPHLVIYLDTTARENVVLSFNARDIDNSTANAVQPIAVQYRIGETGLWTNLPPPGQPASTPQIADATGGPSEASLVTPVTVVLPAAANDQAQLQLRVITTNAVGSDEWVGIDDITVTSTPAGVVAGAPPVNTVPGAQIIEEDSTTPIAGVSVADADSAGILQVQLTVQYGTLTVASGGASITGNGSTTVQIAGTLAAVNASLAGLEYQAAAGFVGADILIVLSNDGSGGTDADTVAVTVTAVNDAPVNSMPAAQEIEANTATAIPGLSIADVDAGSGAMTTTLSVSNGTLVVAAVDGALVSGSGTATVMIAGTLAQLDATLGAGNVSYLGARDFFGVDVLTMVTNDGGNGGAGGPLTTTSRVVIDLHTHLTGTPGDDAFAALPGNERIDAGSGIDTVAFGFRLTEATVSYAGNRVIIDGPSSHTVLTGFEVFQFTDGTVNDNDGNWLVDDLFYYSRYHDVWNAHVDADEHYASFGWHEGRDPDAFFSTAGYLSANPDVQAACVNPLEQWHVFGWTEGRMPSPRFDGADYLVANPDVAAADADPLEHFLAYGAGELREPFASPALAAPDVLAFAHGLANDPDVASSRVGPLMHCIPHGAPEGRSAFVDGMLQ